MFNFKNYLLQELHSNNVIVQEEQLFAKNGTLEPDKIYVVIKYLTSSIEYGAETLPIQMLVLSEQNGLQEAKELFDNFTQTHNWLAKPINGTFVKQQYSSPVVMSNFNEAAYGNRSILYISATLYLMNNVEDIENLMIDNIKIKALSFNWSYQMTGNTQPMNEEIASTVKSIATFQASLAIPVLNDYFETKEGQDVDVTALSGQIIAPAEDNYPILKAEVIKGTVEIMDINQTTRTIAYENTEGELSTIRYWYETPNLLDELFNIANGLSTGNKDFLLSFEIFGISFTYNCKLTNLQMKTAPNDIPMLQVGLQR